MKKKFDKEKWLQLRRKSIGSSDAAALMGLSPFKTAAHVQIEKLEGTPTQEETDLMRLGTLLEDEDADGLKEAIAEFEKEEM